MFINNLKIPYLYQVSNNYYLHLLIKMQKFTYYKNVKRLKNE